jgi:hypothetical protein
MSTNHAVSIEQIKNMDQIEAEAMLRADLLSLESIWDDRLIAYSTSALYARKQVLLDYMRERGPTPEIPHAAGN